MLKEKIVDLYFDLFEKGIIPEMYSGISYSRDNEVLRYSGQLEEDCSSKPGMVYLVKYVPRYLTLNLKKSFRSLNFFEIKGYAIHINGTSNINEYLKIHVKPRLRSAVRSNIRRLESCFNISYRVFYGEIKEKEYDFLFDALHNLLVRRFSQRNEVNKRLKEWSRFHSLFFGLINEKRASLFVIYSDKKPIALSLNYHFDKIFFNAIPSYDIDYGKFGLGHVIIYKQLDWCIKNKMTIFDMSMGNPEYKIKWCNSEYDFEHHIVYHHSSISESICAKLIVYWTLIKKYLKSKNIHILYKKVKTGIYRKSVGGEKNNQILERFLNRFESVSDGDLNAYQYLSKIDFNEQNYSFLKQHVYEFLHKTTEHISDIVVREIERKKIYLINGRTHSKKLFLLKVNDSEQKAP